MTTLDGVHGTVCNAQQYQQSLASPDSRNPSISCLTHGQTIGLALTAEASLISCVAVFAVYTWIAWNVRWYRKNVPRDDWKLFQGPADVYMFSLLGFDILQAMGGVLDIRWAHDGIVTTGPYCTAQGIVQQIGELGVPLITLMLAIHTFVGAMWRVGLQARGFAFGMVVLAWVYVTLWVSIGASIHQRYETPTPYWCWISPRYPGERLGGEYVWLWVALFCSALLYIPLYFWTEGRLSVDDEKWYKFRTSNVNQGVEYAQRRAALGMLLYPLAYCLVVLPLTIARWSLFDHKKVTSAATFFAVSMFNLSGAINVLLFLIVRPQLLLFTRPVEFPEPEIDLSPRPLGDEIFTDAAKYQHSPAPTGTALADGGSRDSPALSRVSASSRRRSDDV